MMAVRLLGLFVRLPLTQCVMCALTTPSLTLSSIPVPANHLIAFVALPRTCDRGLVLISSCT